ncbi:MAG: NlpC/P60 family protein [Holophaga sp.]|nr:NlpC/P60 family protein [Holophaga sp.]
MPHSLRGRASTLLACLALLLAFGGCARGPATRSRPAERKEAAIPRLGFTIQAGAFAKPENAARLAERLQTLGLNAVYYASAPEGAPHRLYRVRFGDFPTREAARARAEALRASEVIEAFYIVAPEEPPLAGPSPQDEDGTRANLVATANNYLGVPYLWGGTSDAGFDCSGLTMAVYRLNGLQLPRSSRDQFARGTPVTLAEARKGDLLFFTTNHAGTVSHVGIYVGGETFIHAPKHGRKISRERLSAYYRDRLVGVRSYI